MGLKSTDFPLARTETPSLNLHDIQERTQKGHALGVGLD